MFVLERKMPQVVQMLDFFSLHENAQLHAPF